MKRRGLFIVLEGLDRSGKTTQVNRLLNYFEKKKLLVKEMEFPTRDSPTGKIIHEFLTKTRMLNDQTIHLLYTTNRWEKNEEILETLNNGISIVCSRYSYSGLAYSSAKDGMDFKWCIRPEVGLPCPDIVFYLKTEVKIVKKRSGFGDEAYEKPTFQEKVRLTFEKIVEHDSSQEGDNVFKVVNASREIDKVSEDIAEIVDSYLKLKEIPKVKKLWTKVL